MRSLVSLRSVSGRRRSVRRVSRAGPRRSGRVVRSFMSSSRVRRSASRARRRAALTSRPSSRRSASSRRFLGRVVWEVRGFFSAEERLPGRGLDGGREVLSGDGLRGAGRSAGRVGAAGSSSFGRSPSLGFWSFGLFGGLGSPGLPGLPFFRRMFFSMSPSRSATLPMNRPTPSIRNVYTSSSRATTPAATALAKGRAPLPLLTDFRKSMNRPKAARISLSAPQAVWSASMIAMTQPAPGMSFATTFSSTRTPMMTGSWGTASSQAICAI